MFIAYGKGIGSFPSTPGGIKVGNYSIKKLASERSTELESQGKVCTCFYNFSCVNMITSF